MRLLASWPLAIALLAGCAGRVEKESSSNSADASKPKLLAPSVRKIWKPARMTEGGLEWEEGHYIYRIERNTTWSR
jgi:hypothetical protein